MYMSALLPSPHVHQTNQLLVHELELAGSRVPHRNSEVERWRGAPLPADADALLESSQNLTIRPDPCPLLDVVAKTVS